MCYINLNNLFKIESVHNIVYLLILKQATKKDVSQYLLQTGCTVEHLNDLKEQGYVKFIKGKKGQTEWQKARLDKKGTKFLNSLDEPEVEDQDIKIFNWLSEIYKKREKEIGNGKKTKRLIASFREKSGIEKNYLAFLCQTFIRDENEQEYSHVLEYIFWKPKNIFQTKFVLEDSRLYKYYLKNKDMFDKKFVEIKQ